jgi:hypothetical protein
MLDKFVNIIFHVKDVCVYIYIWKERVELKKTEEKERIFCTVFSI